MHLTTLFWTAGAAASLSLAGCDFRLPAPGSGTRGGGGAGGLGAVAEGLAVAVEPEARFDGLPRAVRLRITSGSPLTPGAIALVRGEVGPNQLRDIGKQDPSATLQERIIPALSWRDGASIVLGPSALLDPGERYTLAIGELRETVELRTLDINAPPLLRRTWPPPGAAPGQPFGIWCGDAPLPEMDAEAALAPDGPAGFLRRGAVEDGAGAHCVRFEPSSGASAEGVSWLPPPSVTSLDGKMLVGIEPFPIRSEGGALAVPSLPCEPDEIVFGPGCARFADDRLFGRAPAVPLLWAVRGAGADAVIAVGAGDPFTIAGLPPSTDVTLDVAAIDERGTRVRMLTSAVTGPPMPHVIINEVLANPLGPEPASEWVEIVNDGLAPADLGGWVLADGGGDTALPAFTLPPGGYALIVNETFMDDNGVDPAPAPGAVIVRVPHLGKNGLTNSGELLALRDAAGAVISRFPALPKPKAGQSVARRAPFAPDALASSFTLSEPSPGEANDG